MGYVTNQKAGISLQLNRIVLILINEFFVLVRSSRLYHLSFFHLQKKNIITNRNKCMQHYTKKKYACVRVYSGQYSTQIISFSRLTLHLARSITVLKIRNEKRLVRVKVIIFFFFFLRVFLFFFSSQLSCINALCFKLQKKCIFFFWLFSNDQTSNI